jgi:hypothetical protein
MAEFFASGLVVDAILALMVLQFALLCALRVVVAKAPPPLGFLPTMLAGAGLLLALRAALTGAAWHMIAAWLLAGLAAHLFDLYLRRPWR